jgi:hypothetical protein
MKNTDEQPAAIPPGPWRVGRHFPRNLYIETGPGECDCKAYSQGLGHNPYCEAVRTRGVDVGRMDTPELAAHVVAAVNEFANLDVAVGVGMEAVTTARAELEQARAEIERLTSELAEQRRDDVARRAELTTERERAIGRAKDAEDELAAARALAERYRHGMLKLFSPGIDYTSEAGERVVLRVLGMTWSEASAALKAIDAAPGRAATRPVPENAASDAASAADLAAELAQAREALGKLRDLVATTADALADGSPVSAFPLRVAAEGATKVLDGAA